MIEEFPFFVVEAHHRARAVELKVWPRAFQSSCGRRSSKIVAISMLRMSWSYRNHWRVSGSVEMGSDPLAEVEVWGYGGVFVPSTNP
jgi:hypothetical protein